MIFNNLKNSFVSAAACLVLAGTAVPGLAAPVKNIVLVHGAFVDGSGWKPAYDILVKAADGFVFLDPANFPADFAADLPREPAEFMAHAQMLTAAKVFTTPITNPAWKLKPSWYLVAKADKTINPDLERMYAERAHSHKVEVEGASHAVY